MKGQFFFKSFVVLALITIIGLLLNISNKDIQVSHSDEIPTAKSSEQVGTQNFITTTVQAKDSIQVQVNDSIHRQSQNHDFDDNIEFKQRSLPPHMDFVELLEEMTGRHHNEAAKDYKCCTSMRAGAAPDTKILWQTSYIEDLNFQFFPFKKGGEGRKGKVYISLDGTPTNQYLDTIVKPSPWYIHVMGPNAHLVYDIFLSSDFSWEGYRDFGEYLANKGLAKHLTALDSNEINCNSQWYEVRLPAAGKKKHQPFWMGVYKEYGNRSGVVLIWIVFEKPDENPLRCVINSDNYTEEEAHYMTEGVPFIKL